MARFQVDRVTTDYSEGLRTTQSVQIETPYTQDYEAMKRHAVRAAKAAVGLSGVRGKAQWLSGNVCEWRKPGESVLIFAL